MDHHSGIGKGGYNGFIWWWKTIFSFCQWKPLPSSPGGSMTCPQEIEWLEKWSKQRSVYTHIGAVTLDPPVPPSLPGRRRIIFFLRVEPGKNGEKATSCWITADEKPSNLGGASAVSVGHGNQVCCKHVQSSICMHGNKALWSSCHLGEMIAMSPSDFKESKTLVYAGRILSWLFSSLSWSLSIFNKASVWFCVAQMT